MGARFFRNGVRTLQLLEEWWAWPMRLRSRAARAAYLHGFPGEQNALNDAILANASHRRCVHVVPNRELYGPPGHFARHFTGVGADKEALFLARWPSAAVGALIDFFPEWNATACATEERHVRMPAKNAQGATMLGVDVAYTRHCLDERMASRALRERLWPRTRAAGRGALAG